MGHLANSPPTHGGEFSFLRILDGTVYRGDALLSHAYRTITTSRDAGKPTPPEDIIAAIEACTSTKCEAIVGEPSIHMTNALLSLLHMPPERCIMTGDRLETDVPMGLNAGMTTAPALTGATSLQDAQVSTITPRFILNNPGDLLPEASQ